MGYVIVSCIQLGATVDYAILMTNNFMESKARLGRKEATIDAIATTTPPLLTSATILTMVGYILYFTSSISAIADIGHLIGRGTMFGFILVITVLPALLYIFDKPVQKHMARMERLREKKEAKQKALRQNLNSKIPFLNARNEQSV
jgi:hypothetical protein